MAARDTEQLVVSLEARIRDFERNFQKANRTANRNFNRITTGSARASRRLETDFTRASTRMNAALATTTRHATAFARGMAGAFMGGFAAFGAAQLPGTIRSIVTEVSELGKAADRLGITATALQELHFAADLAGMSANELDRNMERFTQRIGEAATRGGRLADILRANGIALRDANGQIRPAIDLLRDFANLIRNAGSDQERMTLATEAFGRSGGAMINMLQDGADAFDEMRQEAHEAGSVLEDDVVRAAERVDDQFATLARNLSTNVKRAIVGITEDVSALGDSLNALDPVLERLIGLFGHLESEETRARGALRAKLLGIEAGWIDPLADFEGYDDFTSNPDAAPTPAPAPTTVIPESGSGGGRGAARQSARAQRDAVAELITSLEEELRLVNASDVERRISNELRRAGADATAEQQARITELATAIETERAATARLETVMDDLQGTARDVLGGFISDLRNGVDATEALHNALDRVLDKLIELALNTLFENAFAGLGGGLLGGLFGFSDGGTVNAATGGLVRGPGTATSDSIPARLSDGEYVVNARQTARHRDLLEAINAGRVPAFADGGLVSTRAHDMPDGPTIGGTTVTVAPITNVTIEGGSRGEEADREMAARVGKQVEGAMRGLVTQELRTQMRPGGMLRQ